MYFALVSDVQDKYKNGVILYFCYQSIIADTVAPLSAKISFKPFTELSGN